MSDKKRRQSEDNIYVEMLTPKLPPKQRKFSSEEDIYVVMKDGECNRDLTHADTSEEGDLTNDSPKFTDQHRRSGTGKDDPQVVDLTCNCALPCEGPCTNGLVSKKITLYETLLTNYQNEIQASKTEETTIDPPPRKKRSLKREASDESGPIKHSEEKSVASSAKKNLAHFFSLSTLDDAKDDCSIEIDDDNITSQIKTEDFSSLFPSTPINEGSNCLPRRNSSLPDLHSAGGIISNSKKTCSYEELSVQQQISDNENNSIEPKGGSGEENQPSNDQITTGEKHRTPKRPSRKKSGILSIHSKLSGKHDKAHHATFSFPAITGIKSQNELFKTNSSIRASVNILDLSKRCKNVPHTMRKANSVAALTPHEHENPSNLNVRRRLEKTKRTHTLRKRFNKAFGFHHSNSSCWPKVFRRKKLTNRTNSIKFLKRCPKTTSQSTESFATIFLSNDRRFSNTLPDNWKSEGPSENLFTTDVQESIEFPQHISMPEVKGKSKRRTLRERLLSPKKLLSKDSTTSLDSVALRKAISFLESSLHPSGSSNENDINTNEKKQVVQSLNRQESDESVGESSETLDSITSAKSAGCVQRTVSHDGSTESDFFKKISLKTNFFLRTASIPDMAPRILNAFSKNTSSSESEDRNSNECTEGGSKSSKFSKRLSIFGSLFSTEPISENVEEESMGGKCNKKGDTCTAEVHGVKSEGIKTESPINLKNNEEEETDIKVDVFCSERKPSIVVTDGNLHDHLQATENTNASNGSENATQIPVLAENSDQECHSLKSTIDSTNTESEALNDNLLSPQTILVDIEHTDSEDFFHHFGGRCDIFSDATNDSAKRTLKRPINLEQCPAPKNTVLSSVENQSHESSDKPELRERSEIANPPANKSEYSDPHVNNGEKTICDDEHSVNLEMPSSSTLPSNGNKPLRQFALNISPLKSENTEVENEQNLIVDRVLKTERCVDTGRTVITYNAPLNGEHVKIDLHEIDPSVIPLEKCADTGRTVIGCKVALGRLNSQKNPEDEVFETSSVQESSVGNQSSDTLGNEQGQNLPTAHDTTSSDLNQFWSSLEGSPCNDCESPACGIPIVCIDTDVHQEETIVSEELHEEITSWKRNMCNEGYFKTNTRSNLLPPDDRRRIRANSIIESDFECEEASDDPEHNDLRKTIKDEFQHKRQSLNSTGTDETEKDLNCPAELEVPRVSSSDNILKISSNDDFFDFFRDRAQEEHYAYILESDSENEEECAKAVVEYLVNARRGSVETLLSRKSEDSNLLRPQKVNVETGSLALSDCSSRRSSKMEPMEPIKDDIYDYFDGGTGNHDNEGNITKDFTLDATKCNPDISKSSDKEFTHQCGTKILPNNPVSHATDSDATDPIVMPNDHSDNALNQFFRDKYVLDCDKIDEIDNLGSVNRNLSISDERGVDEDCELVDNQSNNTINSELVVEKSDNDTGVISDHGNVSGNEEVSENAFSVKNSLAATTDIDERPASDGESISGKGQVETGTKRDEQQACAVATTVNKLQCVKKTDEGKAVEPESHTNENTEENHSPEKQLCVEVLHQPSIDSNGIKYIETIITENKREIVRKEGGVSSIISGISSGDGKENATNTVIVTPPCKPPRLFTVGLIPEHSWRSKSSRERSRNCPNSLQPGARDLHVTKSFDDIPARVHSIQKPFTESEIVRKIQSAERLPINIRGDGKSRIPSDPISESYNRANDSVKQVNNNSDEMSVEHRKSTLDSQNYSSCPNKSNDIFDYFKDVSDSADADDIKLPAENNPASDMKVSPKNVDDLIGNVGVNVSHSTNNNDCLGNKIDRAADSVSDGLSPDLDNKSVENEIGNASRNLIVTVDASYDGLSLSPPNSTSIKRSDLTATSSTPAMVNREVNNEELKPKTSAFQEGMVPSDRAEFVRDVRCDSNVNELALDRSPAEGEKSAPKYLPSEQLLDSPKVNENQRGIFLQDSDDFFDYFDNAKGPPNLRLPAQRIMRLDSIETSDVTGFSIFPPNRNCCENHHCNSNVNCQHFCDSTLMLETKLPLMNQDFDLLRSVKLNSASETENSASVLINEKPQVQTNIKENQIDHSKHELTTSHQHQSPSMCETGKPKNTAPDALEENENICCKSSLSGSHEVSVESVETDTTLPNDFIIEPAQGLDVGSDIHNNAIIKIPCAPVNSSENNPTESNGSTIEPAQGLAAPFDILNEMIKIPSVPVNFPETGSDSTNYVGISPKVTEDMQEAEPRTVLQENFAPKPATKIGELSKDPCNDDVNVVTTDSQAQTRSATPAVEPNRRGSCLKERDDFYDYVDEHSQELAAKKKTPTESSGIDCQHVDSGSNNDRDQLNCERSMDRNWGDKLPSVKLYSASKTGMSSSLLLNDKPQVKTYNKEIQQDQSEHDLSTIQHQSSSQCKAGETKKTAPDALDHHEAPLIEVETNPTEPNDLIIEQAQGFEEASGIHNNEIKKVSSPIMNLSENNPTEPNDPMIETAQGLAGGANIYDNELNKVPTTLVNVTETCFKSNGNFVISPKEIEDLQQAEPSNVQQENITTLSDPKMKEHLNVPCADDVKNMTVDSQANRRGSFLEENDDFYDYFNKNSKELVSKKKTPIDCQHLVNDSKHDSVLKIPRNERLPKLSSVDISSAIIEYRKGSFKEGNDDFFDNFGDNSEKATENQEQHEISQKSLSSDTIELRDQLHCEGPMHRDCGDKLPGVKLYTYSETETPTSLLLNDKPQLKTYNKENQQDQSEHELSTFHQHLSSSQRETGQAKKSAPHALEDKENICPKSNLSDYPETSLKDLETILTEPNDLIIEQAQGFEVESDIHSNEIRKVSSPPMKLSEKNPTGPNSLTSKAGQGLDVGSNVNDNELNKVQTTRVNLTETYIKSTDNFVISPKEFEDLQQAEPRTVLQENVTTLSDPKMKDHLNVPGDDDVKDLTADSQAIIAYRRGSFIEDNDDFFDYFNDNSVKTPENHEQQETSQKSFSSDAIELTNRESDIYNDDLQAHANTSQQTITVKTENDVSDVSVLRCSMNSSDDFDIKESPFSSKSNGFVLNESNSDFSQVSAFESGELLSSDCGNEKTNEQLDDAVEHESSVSTQVLNNEETVTNRTLNCAIEVPSEMQKEVMKSGEKENSEISDSHHIESIEKDHITVGPRRRSVTFNLPLLKMAQESTIMVSYSSNEDPFEYFSTCEPVATVLKNDPFAYFTTSNTVSVFADIQDDELSRKRVNDSELKNLRNAKSTSDQPATHTGLDFNQHDSQQHEPHHHDTRRRESHFDLLPIVEANPDQLAIEEASYELKEESETHCTSNDSVGAKPSSDTGGSKQAVPECVPDSSYHASSKINFNELKQSLKAIDPSKEQCCYIDETDSVSQQKPVILNLIPKETSENANDQGQNLGTSDTELNKPSNAESLVDLPVAKVFEIIDLAEKSGSTSSLTKVAEELISNSPQFQTKFKHQNTSSETKNEGSSLPKSVSISYETLVDSADGSGNSPDAFPSTNSQSWKPLFPNVSTSDLSNLEQMDDNYSPRSLALGKPTIILQTWFERQKQGNAIVRPARSSSDLASKCSRLSVPQNNPSVARSESLPPRRRLDTPSPGTPVDQFKEDIVEEQPQRQEERVQKDRSLDVYPETLRQRQRPRNMAPSPSKVDIKNWNQNGSPIREPESPASGKKFLPSVKALRNQFETGKNLNNSSSNNGSVSPTSTFSMSSSSSNASTGSTQGCGGAPISGGSVPRAADPTASLSRKLSGSSLASSSLEKSSSNTSLNSAPSTENLLDGEPHNPDEPVEPIFCQFQKVDEELRELMSRPTSTSGWDPRSLLKRLYYVPDAPRIHSKGHSYVNIEGYLEKLPSGRKKATFWNAWKKRYFVAKDGVLYYYQNSQCDKPSLRLTLMGGKVETMEGNMVGVDDGKGHYVVVRCSSRSEADRWRRALESHLVEDFASQYVQPHPMPTNPSLLRDTLIIDIGSCSVRAGVLSSQATLPQLFFPSVVATDRESRRQVWGQDALAPETRSSASLSFPMKPSHRISKYSVDLTAVTSLLVKTFSDLKVDPKNYNLQISVPRVLNQHTQSELLRTLFEKFGVKGVNVTHQSILALYAYNATSGIVVDIGERMDIVPVTDGYIVEGGVSRVPYGGCRILDHLRQFLYMRNVSLVNDVESYIIRHVLESACYCAQHYNTEKARCTNHPENFEKTVSLKEFFPNTAQCPYDAVELDFGRFQATEGLFNPDAWGLDHPGLHKLVHKAIQECSMDIRKEMSRSIFLAGGVTQLPGLADRLTTELDNLTPPAIRPKVHVSPYRYHAAYIGACTLAESPAFTQTLITRENWAKNGNAALRKWAL